MKLIWHEDAIGDLISIKQYIAEDSPQASHRLAHRIVTAVNLLIEQSELGRNGRIFGTRELIIAGTPYIIPYRVKNNNVEILRILHSAMQWPEIF